MFRRSALIALAGFSIGVTDCFAASEFLRSLNITDDSYASGNLAIAAYPRWETVVVGPIPAVAGSVSLARGSDSPALKIVAVMSQDRTAHALILAKKRFSEISSDPSSKLIGERVLLSPGSTGQMFAEKCLAGWGLTLEQTTVVPGEQHEILQALANKGADVAFVWSPSAYAAKNGVAKASVLTCIGTEALDIPSLIVVRADMLRKGDPGQLTANRKGIALTVARHLGAWAKASRSPVDAAKRLVNVYAGDGIKVTQAEASAELSARRPPDFEAQRVAFAVPAGGGDAPVVGLLEAIMDFMVASKSLKAVDRPAGADLIDASILEEIAADAELTAIARGEE